MKQTVKIISPNGDSTTFTRTIRDLDHFATQLGNRTKVVMPKKGKGSFKRKGKYGNKYEE